MKKTVVSIGNGLLAEAITKMLTDSGEFQPYRVPVGAKQTDVVAQCKMLSADMMIAEVSYSSHTSIGTRLSEAKRLRFIYPKCQIVLLCDENSSPEIARQVMLAKKDGVIDAFFYSSVTVKYLLAALEAL